MPNELETSDAIRAQVHAIAHAIPPARVMSYGAVGAACEPPISGYVCGRIMSAAMGDVPWWRVVGKDGKLPISKRNPNLAREQRELLEAEGVAFDDEGCVLMERFRADTHTAAQPNLFDENSDENALHEYS